MWRFHAACDSFSLLIFHSHSFFGHINKYIHFAADQSIERKSEMFDIGNAEKIRRNFFIALDSFTNALNTIASLYWRCLSYVLEWSNAISFICIFYNANFISHFLSLLFGFLWLAVKCWNKQIQIYKACRWYIVKSPLLLIQLLFIISNGYSHPT